MTAEEYIEKLPLWAEKKNTLPEIREFLTELGSPDRDMKIIHVAGTNGKGSVCAYLTRALMDAGKSVGTFISPHLTDVKERFLLNGSPVSEADFTEAAEVVKKTAAVMTVVKGFVHPSYFEFLFYMAMVLFREKKPDYVILETGLGGRKDATNVCRPVLTVITSISMDHMQYLGNTIEEIAGEKAGIIKPGIPLVYDRNNPAAEKVILKRAEELAAPAFGVDPNALQGSAVSMENAGTDRFSFLPAPYMRENAQLAAQAFALLKAGDAALFTEAVRHTHWAGRMDEIRPDVFLDGAHNADGIRAFAEAASQLMQQRGKKCSLLMSAVSDKDFMTMSREIAGELQPEKIYLCKLNSSRAADPAELQKDFEAAGLKACPCGSVREAWEKALKEKKEDTIVFCAGSLYLVGEILKQEEKIR